VPRTSTRPCLARRRSKRARSACCDRWPRMDDSPRSNRPPEDSPRSNRPTPRTPAAVEAELRRRIRSELEHARSDADGELTDAALASVIARAIGAALGWHLEGPEHARTATLSSRQWRPAGGPRGGPREGGARDERPSRFDERPRYDDRPRFEERRPPRPFPPRGPREFDAPFDDRGPRPSGPRAGGNRRPPGRGGGGGFGPPRRPRRPN
jgi:hypothetical protein